MRCRRGPSDKARDEHHKHEDRREADHHEAEELHGALGERGVSRDVLADLRPASDACEPQDDQAAHGQGDVAREEVEEVEDRLAAEEGDVGELAEREAGQGADDGERERGEHGRARTLHLVLVDEEGDDDLDHRDGRRDGRHRDAQVEDHGEDLTERKLREDGGHRDEGEAGTCGRVESEGEDARHDHQAAENGGDDRKERDPEAAVDEVRVLIKVRAVGEHAPATHAQREESEAHGLQQGAPGEGVGIELEEELKAAYGAGEHQAAHDEHEHHHEEERHQELGDALDALRDVERHDEAVEQQEEPLEAECLDGIGDEAAEVLAELALVGDEARARGRFGEVGERPPSDGRIEAQDEEARENAEIACGHPGAACEVAVGRHDAAAARTAERHFGDQQGGAHGEGHEDVGEEKGAAAVRARHVGELPDGPQTHGSTGAGEHEADSARPGLSLFSGHKYTP